jgi:hypothetical protein
MSYKAEVLPEALAEGPYRGRRRKRRRRRRRRRRFSELHAQSVVVVTEVRQLHL